MSFLFSKTAIRVSRLAQLTMISMIFGPEGFDFLLGARLDGLAVLFRVDVFDVREVLFFCNLKTFCQAVDLRGEHKVRLSKPLHRPTTSASLPPEPEYVRAL